MTGSNKARLFLLAHCGAFILGSTIAVAQSSEEPTEVAGEPTPAPTLRFEAEEPYPPYVDWAAGEAETSVPSELEEIYTPRQGLFDVPALDGSLDKIIEWSTALEEATGLRIGVAYTMIFQQASGGPGRRYGASGDLDIFGAWTLLGRGTKDTGTLVVSGEYRHKIGPISAGDLRDELGTLNRTTNGFNDRGWVVRDFYWLQRLLDDRLRFLVGRADPSDFFGAHRMQNLNASFHNRVFSANTVVPSPGHGMTAGLSIRPTDEFFITTGASNAYGRTSVNDMSTLDEADFFTFAEFGFTPTIEGLGSGRYRLLIWHMDAREDLDLSSDRGFSIIIDQELGDVLQVFARYGYSDEALTNIQNSIEAGFGFRGLLGAPNNLTGVAFAYAEPKRGDGRDEKVLEGFHRWQLTKHTQFSLGVQGIFDPSNSDADSIAVFTARFRVAF